MSPDAEGETLNVISLFKAARSSSLLDFPSLFKSLGVKAEIAELAPGEYERAFQQAARASMKSGASVVRIKGTMPDGTEMDAVMVMNSAHVAEMVTKESKKTLDALPASL